LVGELKRTTTFEWSAWPRLVENGNPVSASELKTPNAPAWLAKPWGTLNTAAHWPCGSASSRRRLTSTGLPALLRHIGRLDSHVRQIVALVIAGVTFLFFIRHGRSPITHLIVIWDIYAIVVLLMTWVTIWTANPRTIQQRARLQDSSRTLIFAFIIVAACMSLLAVILVLREHKEFQKTGGLHLFMAALAVIESWLLIHTVFTLRYAHVFYRSEQEADVEGSGGGLIFPGGHNSGLPGFDVHI
jgi:uncharacterized membrane protein